MRARNSEKGMRAKAEVTDMRRVGLSVLGVVALAAGLWAGMSSAGSTQSDGTGLKAALNVAQEVPRPKGAGSQARGAFVGTRGPQGHGRNGRLAPDLQGADRKGDGGARAPGGERQAGAGCASSVRALPQRSAWLGSGECEDRPGPARWRCVRERAYGYESGRRDPWADSEGRSRPAAVYDDRHHHDDRPDRPGLPTLRPLIAASKRAEGRGQTRGV